MTVSVPFCSVTVVPALAVALSPFVSLYVNVVTFTSLVPIISALGVSAPSSSVFVITFPIIAPAFSVTSLGVVALIYGYKKFNFNVVKEKRTKRKKVQALDIEKSYKTSDIVIPDAQKQYG